MTNGRLTFFCGKMGAGKSTKAASVARSSDAVLLSEDEWLELIYPNKISTLADYIQYSNHLKLPIKELVQAVLASGIDVVMDFPANTLGQRSWLRSIYSEIGAPHELFYIDRPNEVCLQQIEQRRLQQPERASTDTPEMFEQVTKHFVEPTVEEGFNIVSVY